MRSLELVPWLQQLQWCFKTTTKPNKLHSWQQAPEVHNGTFHVSISFLLILLVSNYLCSSVIPNLTCSVVLQYHAISFLILVLGKQRNYVRPYHMQIWVLSFSCVSHQIARGKSGSGSIKWHCPVTFTKSFWQIHFYDVPQWDFQILQHIQFFQADQLSKVKKKIGKTVRKSSRSNEKEVFCKIAVLEAQAAHIADIDGLCWLTLKSEHPSAHLQHSCTWLRYNELWWG